jgi:hypothetical protein
VKINAFYDYRPTPRRSGLGRRAQIALDDLLRTPWLTVAGSRQVLPRRGTVRPRADGLFYLPPGYLGGPRVRVPVPGGLQNWLAVGRLTAVMDALAAARDGLLRW